MKKENVFLSGTSQELKAERIKELVAKNSECQVLIVQEEGTDAYTESKNVHLAYLYEGMSFEDFSKMLAAEKKMYAIRIVVLDCNLFDETYLGRLATLINGHNQSGTKFFIACDNVSFFTGHLKKMSSRWFSTHFTIYNEEQGSLPNE